MIRLSNLGRVVGFVALTVIAAIAPLQSASGHPSEVVDMIDGNHLQLAVVLYSEVFNGHKAVAAERLIADDAVIHTPRGDFIGPAGLLAYLDVVHRVYPDATFAITAIEVDGDTIVVQWNMAATRLQLDPSTEPVLAGVSSPGETTITTAEGQITEMTQAERGTAAQLAEDIAAQDRADHAAGEVTTARSASPVV